MGISTLLTMITGTSTSKSVVVMVFGDNLVIADFGESNAEGFQKVFWSHHDRRWSISNNASRNKQNAIAG